MLIYEKCFTQILAQRKHAANIFQQVVTLLGLLHCPWLCARDCGGRWGVAGASQNEQELVL